MFVIAIKSIAFAWQTNRGMLLLLIVLNFFQGAIVYLQFSSFSRIVDEIIGIKQGTSTLQALIQTSIILGLSFLAPTLIGNFVSAITGPSSRMAQNTQLEMLIKSKGKAHWISGHIESNSYQNLLRSAQEWGTGSILNLQDFIFTSATSFAGILTSMIILWSLNGWLVLFAVLAATPVYFFYTKYSMEVFRIRYFSLDDHRIIGNRISHFEELQKAVDVILLKLKTWLQGQISERKIYYNSKRSVLQKKESPSLTLFSVCGIYFFFLPRSG